MKVINSSGQLLMTGAGGGGGGGTTFSAGVSTLGNTLGNTRTVSDQVVFAGIGGVTLSQSTNAGSATISISANAQTTQPAINALGVSNTGNTAGDTGTSSGITWVVAGSNNITISESTVGGGPNTIWVSGAAAGGAQTGISGIANSQTTFTSGTVSLSDQANITIASSVNGATQIYKFSVAAQSTQPAVNAFGVSNTGNTAGNTGTSSGITWVLAGSNANTLSQSTAGGGPNTVWIQGPVSATTISGVQSANSIGTRGSRFALEDHFHQGIAQVQISGNTSNTSNVVLGSLVLAGGNNVTLSQVSAAGAATVTISAANQTNQSAIKGLGASNTGNTAGNTGLSTGIDWVIAGSNNITISESTAGGGPNTLWVSGPTTAAQTNQSAIKALGASNTGNTAGNTGVSTGIDWVIAGSNQATISESTAGGGPNTLWVNVTTAAQTNQTGNIYVTAQSTAQSSSSSYDMRTLSLVGDGIISIGWSNSTLRFSATQSNQAFSAAGGSSAFQTLSFGDTNSVSWTNTNGSVGIASIKLQMFAVSNTTQSSSGTANHTALSFGGAGIASVGVTGGSVVISVPSGGGAGDGGNTIAAGTRTASTSAVLLFSDSNNFTWGLNAVNGTVMTASYSESVQTMGLYAIGNTTQNSSTTLDARTMSFNGLGAATWGYSNGSIQVSVPATSSLVGASGFTVSTAGSTISVAPILVSSYENMEGLVGSTLMAITTGSVSHAVFFNIPNAVSFSFMRIPVLMTTNSTTIATLASATASASGGLSSTWNAVIYSLGTGANSKSLQSVTSGTTGFSFSQRISVTNSTQASYSLGFSAQANGAGTTRTTQYSISDTNYSFTTNQIATEFSSNRMLDIPFAASLTHGPYWLVLGMSSSTQTGGAVGLAALTNCNVRYSGHYGASQADLSFGIMGSTNMTSGGLMGAGSFSTAGGGTTNSIPISAISSIASLARVYFQLLRSA